MEHWETRLKGKIPGVGLRFDQKNWLQFYSTNNKKLVTYRMKAQNKKALVFFFNGLNESSVSITHIAKSLSLNGYQVLALDLQGHGQSQGKFGVNNCLLQYVYDGAKYIKQALKVYGDITVFCLGYSIGGYISLELSLRIPYLIKGMVLLAPAIRHRSPPSMALWYFVKFLALFAPFIRLGSCDLGQTTVNPFYPEYQRENEQIYHQTGYLITNVSFFQYSYQLSQKIDRVRTPFLVIHGGKDNIISPDFSQKLFELAKTQDKRYIYRQEMKHGIPYEPQIEEFIKEIIVWYNERL